MKILEQELVQREASLVQDNPHVFHCPVVNTEIKEDINCLVNGIIEEMKSALTKLRENMKKFEYFNRWIQYSIYIVIP